MLPLNIYKHRRLRARVCLYMRVYLNKYIHVFFCYSNRYCILIVVTRECSHHLLRHKRACARERETERQNMCVGVRMKKKIKKNQERNCEIRPILNLLNRRYFASDLFRKYVCGSFTKIYVQIIKFGFLFVYSDTFSKSLMIH